MGEELMRIINFRKSITSSRWRPRANDLTGGLYLIDKSAHRAKTRTGAQSAFFWSPNCISPSYFP